MTSKLQGGTGRRRIGRTLQSNNTNYPTEDIPPTTNHTIHFKPVTHKEVLQTIDSLKPKHTAGVEEISAKLAKTCQLEIVTLLTKFVNKSLSQGIISSKLKMAKVEIQKWTNHRNK